MNAESRPLVTTQGHELRREPDPDETLVRCKRCGKIELPLNHAELWHYVRTGEGLATHCPKHLQGWHDWKTFSPQESPTT